MHTSKNKQQTKKHPSIKIIHSRRSIPILVTLAFLLTISVLGIFTVSGLKSTLLEVTVTPTGGKTYLSARCQNNSNDCRETLEKAREQHSGKENGTIKLYQKSPQLGSYFAIDADTVSQFLITSPSSVPEDKIPVLVPDDFNPEDLAPQFMPIGSYTGSLFSEFNTHDTGIFSPILSQITTQVKPVYMINENTNKIEKFLLDKWSQNSEDNTENNTIEVADLLEYEAQILTFDNYKDALNFQRAVNGVKYAIVNDVFSDTLAIDDTFSQVLTIQYWITGLIALLTIAATADVILYLRNKAKQSAK